SEAAAEPCARAAGREPPCNARARLRGAHAQRGRRPRDLGGAAGGRRGGRRTACERQPARQRAVAAPVRPMGALTTLPTRALLAAACLAAALPARPAAQELPQASLVPGGVALLPIGARSKLPTAPS